jgi:hypothetical protein
LKQSNCLPIADWVAANQAAAGLKDGDCGNSSPGDWRLPTQAEWIATIEQAVAFGCRLGGARVPPSLVNDAADGCYGDGLSSSLAGAGLATYWSSTTNTVIGGLFIHPASNAMVANLASGNVNGINPKNGATSLVWPVRSGAR